MYMANQKWLIISRRRPRLPTLPPLCLQVHLLLILSLLLIWCIIPPAAAQAVASTEAGLDARLSRGDAKSRRMLIGGALAWLKASVRELGETATCFVPITKEDGRGTCKATAFDQPLTNSTVASQYVFKYLLNTDMITPELDICQNSHFPPTLAGLRYHLNEKLDALKHSGCRWSWQAPKVDGTKRITYSLNVYLCLAENHVHTHLNNVNSLLNNELTPGPPLPTPLLRLYIWTIPLEIW